eukprot:4690971-Lingulodinium_polyedra.AAC.1
MGTTHQNDQQCTEEETIERVPCEICNGVLALNMDGAYTSPREPWRQQQPMRNDRPGALAYTSCRPPWIGARPGE